MKRNLLSLLIIVCLLIITCGEEPPEEFYEGTEEDSTAIARILFLDYPELLVTEDMFYANCIPFELADVEFFTEDSYFRGDDSIIKRHVDSCGLRLDEKTGQFDFWFAKDTTCTVYLFDTFTVKSLIHVDLKYTAFYDNPIVDTIIDSTVTPWDTTYDTTTLALGTTIIDSTPFKDSSDVFGFGRRLMFFEPEREIDSVVTDALTGDTLEIFWGAIKEPLEWFLKRISYAIYYFPESGPDMPTIDQVTLTPENGEAVTIIASSYDTLYTGHVMNRFRHIDSLIVIDTNDLALDTLTGNRVIQVDAELGFGTLTADQCEFFASCGDTGRVELPVPVGGTGGSGQLVVKGSGITNLHFEVVANGYYYYMEPARDYQAQVWLVPVRITGGVQ